jgi:gluconokinase
MQGEEGMIVVLMGVCGCGKTTVGHALAQALHWPFFDADDFHPEANVARMRAGIPLTDEDRWPWLDRLAQEMAAINAHGGHAVLACSALRQAYRDRLARAGDVRFVHLRGDRATLASRLSARPGHYMPVSLLDSQLATLEEPTGAAVVDIRSSVAEQVAAIRSQLDLAPQTS